MAEHKKKYYNLLENSGFENGYQDWYVPSVYASISNDSFSGTKSATVPSGANDGEAMFRQMVSVPNGKNGDTYVASAFAKAEATSNDLGEF